MLDRLPAPEAAFVGRRARSFRRRYLWSSVRRSVTNVVKPVRASYGCIGQRFPLLRGALRRTVFLALCVAGSAPASGGPRELTLLYRGWLPLPPTARAVDGRVFRIGGLSGITWLGGDRYLAVSDEGGRLVAIEACLGADGRLAALRVTDGMGLCDTFDFEGIAVADLAATRVFVCEEGDASLLEYALAGGERVRHIRLPEPLASSRGLSNRSLEALSLRWRSDGSARDLYVANEDSIAVDGPLSSPAQGALVRIVHLLEQAGAFVPHRQFAYRTEPMHGAITVHGGSGLADLVALPDGRLLALERSFALSPSGLFRTSIFEVQTEHATDVGRNGLELGLAGRSFTPVARRRLFTGSIGGVGQNVEGLTLGPSLGAGRRALVGVIDDRDPVSRSGLVLFELRESDADPVGPTKGWAVLQGPAMCGAVLAGPLAAADPGVLAMPPVAGLIDQRVQVLACTGCGRGWGPEKVRMIPR